MGMRFSNFSGRDRFHNRKGDQCTAFFAALRWKLTSRPEQSPDFISDVERTVPPQTVDGDALRITLVNHSTVLVQQNRCNILTDPIWSERARPLPWIGPRRRREPGILWDDLPRIGAVLISHNHYDHLDLPTLRRLAARGDSSLIVPAGVARQLGSENFKTIHELDWGEFFSLPSFTIYCVPALHFSGRGIHDRNRTLWCGYVIESPQGVIYFAGDTAFGRHFVGIRQRFGPPRLALLPIGAYQPRWLMSPVHMSPDEAIRAHEVLAARTSIAIHHGTFQLGDEGIDTPRKKLIAHAPDDSFMVLKNGQFHEIPR